MTPQRCASPRSCFPLPLLLIALTAASCSPKDAVVKIGVITGTSGPAAPLGDSFVKSIRMAMDDRQGTRRKYELVIEDSGMSLEDTKRATEKLVKTDKVDALLVGLSLLGAVVKPYAAEAKIPNLCVCSVATIGDGVYNFTNIPLPADEAARWLTEAQRRNIKKIALLTEKYPSIEGHVNGLKSEAQKLGIEVVYEGAFEASTTDFSRPIAAAKAGSPDVYFVEAFSPMLEALGQQLRDAGVTNMASIVSFSVSMKPSLFEGNWYTDSYIEPQLKTRLEQAYPDSRIITHMVGYGYDSFNILVDGFERSDDIAAWVQNLGEYSGKAGKITKEKGSGNFRSAPDLWLIKDGRPATAN